MKTIEKIYPSRQVFEITQRTSRLFTDIGEDAVNRYIEKYNLKNRKCNICEKETPSIRTQNNCICVYCNQSVSIEETDKEIIQDISWYQHYEMTQKAGYDDLDIKGYGAIHRACVSHNIKLGDIFNIYLGESTKNGCLWIGTLDESLSRHLKILEHEEKNGEVNLNKDYLCRCNNCDAILLDKNPRNSNAARLTLIGNEINMIRIKDKDTKEYFWGCPNCHTDDYLTDLSSC